MLHESVNVVVDCALRRVVLDEDIEGLYRVELNANDFDDLMESRSVLVEPMAYIEERSATGDVFVLS